MTISSSRTSAADVRRSERGPCETSRAIAAVRPAAEAGRSALRKADDGVGLPGADAAMGTPPPRPSPMPTQEIAFWTLGSILVAAGHAFFRMLRLTLTPRIRNSDHA